MRPMSRVGLRIAHAIGEQVIAVVASREHAKGARLHRAELAGVDEERLAQYGRGPPCLKVLAGLVAGEEPEAGGNAGGEEELGRQGDDAIHEVGLDDTAGGSRPRRRSREESEPLAMTKPATPPPRPLGGARWWMKCWIQA